MNETEAKYESTIKKLEAELKEERADRLFLQQQFNNLRSGFNTGRATLSTEPRAEELERFLPLKLSQHSLREVCEEVAKAQGFTLQEFVRQD